MKQKKSSRRLSRKFRKLVKAGKLKFSDKFVKENKLSTKQLLEKNILPINKIPEKNIPSVSDKIAATANIPDRKRKEIIGHLRTVMLTSLFCLLVLGILYYLDQQNNWVNKLNSGAKDFLTSWNWQI